MVVALWGKTGGSASELAENAHLVSTSHAVARACGATRLLHLSSAAVYGPGQALTETAPTRPANDYGRSKLAMEQAVSRLPQDGITHCCLRLANVVGADSLAPGLTGAAPVTLDQFPDGNGPLRSYLATGDLLQVICGLALLPPGDLPAILNVTSPTPVGMAALVAAAGRSLVWRPAPETAIQEVTLDASRLTRRLPTVPFHRSADSMIADWQTLETAQ